MKKSFCFYKNKCDMIFNTYADDQCDVAKKINNIFQIISNQAFLKLINC